MFSLKAPTHPAKPIIKTITPTIINISPGSTKNSVISPMFLNISFSDHAHTPMAISPNPRSYKISRKREYETRKAEREEDKPIQSEN